MMSNSEAIARSTVSRTKYSLWLNSEDLTVYKIDCSGVDGKPEVQFICLKVLVGERGFEPPTPWSRTRCSTRLSHSPTKAIPCAQKRI
jgi:hypothetical protein